MTSAGKIFLSPLLQTGGPVEIVERKGLGHPDTICDALAEALSQRLCEYYRENFGTILHHNVDKALLCGGASRPGFGGGEVTEPFDIYLAGRATARVGTDEIPLRDLAIETAREWLSKNLHAHDPARHARIHCLIRSGSSDLVDIFERGKAIAVPHANDTSIGVGFAPFSPLEKLVLDVERGLTQRARDRICPAWGEDVKVLGVRTGDSIRLTIACAMVDCHVSSLRAYKDHCEAIHQSAMEIAGLQGIQNLDIAVNAGDDLASGKVYLTVTGTSAEAGDDGEVGRGNRANGLITPYRPMTMEAAAGKNPVNHVGKLYNVVARTISENLVANIAEIDAVQCCMASRIGYPISEPAIVDLQIAMAGPVEDLRDPVKEIVTGQLQNIPNLIERFIDGQIDLF